MGILELGFFVFCFSWENCILKLVKLQISFYGRMDQSINVVTWACYSCHCDDEHKKQTWVGGIRSKGRIIKLMLENSAVTVGKL